jgi:hypothetical protein
MSNLIAMNIELIEAASQNYGKPISSTMFRAFTKIPANEYWLLYKGYYFFQQELDLRPTESTWKYMKDENIRHLIHYKNKFYDYITHKEYSGIEEWAVDNGRQLTDIRYGVNKIRGEYALNPKQYYVDLLFLLQSSNPAWEILPEMPVVNIPVWNPEDDEEPTMKQVVSDLVSTLSNLVAIIQKLHEKMD